MLGDAVELATSSCGSAVASIAEKLRELNRFAQSIERLIVARMKVRSVL